MPGSWYGRNERSILFFSPKHLRCLGSRFVASAAEERDKASVVVDGRWVWMGLWMEQEGAQYGRCAGVDGAVDGRKGARDGRRVGVDGVGEGREGRESVDGSVDGRK